MYHVPFCLKPVCLPLCLPARKVDKCIHLGVHKFVMCITLNWFWFQDTRCKGMYKAYTSAYWLDVFYDLSRITSGTDIWIETMQRIRACFISRHLITILCCLKLHFQPEAIDANRGRGELLMHNYQQMKCRHNSSGLTGRVDHSLEMCQGVRVSNDALSCWWSLHKLPFTWQPAGMRYVASSGKHDTHMILHNSFLG